MPAQPEATDTLLNPGAASHAALHRAQVNVKAYGAVGDGVANDGPAIALAIADLPTNGGTLLFPPGTYLTNQQLTIGDLIGGTNLPQNVTVMGYGATLKTSGAISALKFYRGGGHRVQGLHIDHTNNASATFGIELVGSSRVTLEQMHVLGDANLNGSYAAYRLVPYNTSNPSDFGSFWCRIKDCMTQSTGAAKPFNVGIQLEGGANHTIIEGCTIGNCVTSIMVRDMIGASISCIPNGCVVRDSDISGTTNAIVVKATVANGVLCGPYVVFNRFEQVSGPIITIDATTPVAAMVPTVMFNQYSGGPGSFFSAIGGHSVKPNGFELADGIPVLGQDAKYLNQATQNTPLELLWMVAGRYDMRDTGVTRGTIASIGSIPSIKDSSGNGVRFRTADDSVIFSVDTNGSIIQPKAGTYHEMLENGTTDAAAGAANTFRLFARDNGSGKTQMCVRFNTGDVQVIAEQV